ncbi:hypothetical protein EDB85DRAFT_1961061 [Lactarius pseudohatsudake]|nr:hypothetical protein EDB85DRAFT_1961061 [Lactarius pseudohatsudake]
MGSGPVWSTHKNHAIHALLSNGWLLGRLDGCEEVLKIPQKQFESAVCDEGPQHHQSPVTINALHLPDFTFHNIDSLQNLQYHIGPGRGIDDHPYPPQSAPTQEQRGMSNFVDGSGPIFSIKWSKDGKRTLMGFSSLCVPIIPTTSHRLISHRPVYSPLLSHR